MTFIPKLFECMFTEAKKRKGVDFCLLEDLVCKNWFNNVKICNCQIKPLKKGIKIIKEGVFILDR